MLVKEQAKATADLDRHLRSAQQAAAEQAEQAEQAHLAAVPFTCISCKAVSETSDKL